MLKKIMMIVLGLFSTSSYAAVNLQTGSWMWTISLDGMDIRFNSRSLHQGWWGQGWCSALDQKLKETLEKNMEYSRCGIIEKSAEVTKRNKEYKVHFKNTVTIFDEDFQLRSVKESGRTLIVEKRTENQIFLSVNGKPLVLILHKEAQRVREALSVYLKMDFTYSKNLLIRVQSELKTEDFTYDRLDNMIRIDVKQGKSIRAAMISYSKEDRVAEVQSPNLPCKTRYNYVEYKEQSSIYLYSKVSRICDNNPTSKTILSRFEHINQNEIQLSAVREVTL